MAGNKWFPVFYAIVVREVCNDGKAKNARNDGILSLVTHHLSLIMLAPSTERIKLNLYLLIIYPVYRC